MVWSKLIFLGTLLFGFSCSTQSIEIDHKKIRQDFHFMLKTIKKHYAYLDEKQVDLLCIQQYYESQIEYIQTPNQVILFFEYVLDEFYDSHLILNTNCNSSYRLYAPIYASTDNGKTTIKNVWQTQIETELPDIIGAEILSMNGIDFQKWIDLFPTQCHDKQNENIRNWIGNKVLAGRYDQPRVLSIQLSEGSKMELNLDSLEIKKDESLITSHLQEKIAVIKINNALGTNELITEFDKILNKYISAEGVILDLRNTVDGGNTHVAKGIMSRFINESRPYQMHSKKHKSGQDKTWLEYVKPRKQQYKGPLVVLVGRWTGSMGEGLAIGFEGMNRAQVLGTDMERLAGAMEGFSFKHRRFGFRISTERLYHVNGIPREKYTPKKYFQQGNSPKDELLEKGVASIHHSTNN